MWLKPVTNDDCEFIDNYKEIIGAGLYSRFSRKRSNQNDIGVLRRCKQTVLRNESRPVHETFFNGKWIEEDHPKNSPSYLVWHEDSWKKVQDQNSVQYQSFPDDKTGIIYFPLWGLYKENFKKIDLAGHPIKDFLSIDMLEHDITISSANQNFPIGAYAYISCLERLQDFLCCKQTFPLAFQNTSKARPSIASAFKIGVRIASSCDYEKHVELISDDENLYWQITDGEQQLPPQKAIVTSKSEGCWEVSPPLLRHFGDSLFLNNQQGERPVFDEVASIKITLLPSAEYFDVNAKIFAGAELEINIGRIPDNLTPSSIDDLLQYIEEQPSHALNLGGNENNIEVTLSSDGNCTFKMGAISELGKTERFKAGNLSYLLLQRPKTICSLWHERSGLEQAIFEINGYLYLGDRYRKGIVMEQSTYNFNAIAADSITLFLTNHEAKMPNRKNTEPTPERLIQPNL